MRSAKALAVTLLCAALFGVALARSHHHHNRRHYDEAAPQWSELTAEAQADKITSLPGLKEQPPFNQYAGYLTVDAAHGRKLFYWFVESQNAPATDPVVWWSNGGPGCSGLIGFLTEHGPFSPLPDGKTLQTNYDLSWNRLANMLYIEAPAGVGYSYSNVQSDYNVGDARTASDNYLGVLAFLQKFPQYNNTKFFVSSESYGGHYAPTLGLAIVKGNAAGVNPKINFGGILVGNPYTNPLENNIGAYATFHGHGLIARSTWLGLDQHCFTKPDDDCQQWMGLAEQEIGNVDPYGLDFPVCLSSAEPLRLLQMRNKTHLLPGYPYDPCRDNYAVDYMNLPSVVAAIHANPNLGYPWAECSSVVNYNSSDMDVSMVPLWQQLIAEGNLHLTVYSGDDDSVCGLLGTQTWIDSLQLPVLTPWTSWTDANGQVGGYVTVYGGLKLVTVHSAGHMVGSFQPQRNFELLGRYLKGEF